MCILELQILIIRKLEQKAEITLEIGEIRAVFNSTDSFPMKIRTHESQKPEIYVINCIQEDKQMLNL